MGPVQRRMGMPAIVYRSKVITDNRGNQQRVVDLENPHEIRVWAAPQRSSKASVPGQMDVDVMRLGTTADLEGVDTWSQVDFRGARWDVVAPAAYHHGTRDVRHWSIDCRRRP